ncbi:MAG TPA: hypothetical protein VGV34_03155, partial [Solirubrobacterales bacterium]|nr:hypothetical protein [Solirubrobacterales bacterium]
MAGSMLLVPVQAAAAEPPAAEEVAAETVAAVVEPAPEAAPVEPSAATSEAEAPAPEEASSTEEAPVVEEAPAAEETAASATPASAPEPQPQPEPQVEAVPAEVADTEEAGAPVLDSQPVKAATDLVTATGERLASAGKEVAPVPVPAPIPVDAVANPADLGAGIEEAVAALVDSLEGLTLLETLTQDESSGPASLVRTAGWAGSTAGSTGSPSHPGELLPGPVAELP